MAAGLICFWSCEIYKDDVEPARVGATFKLFVEYGVKVTPPPLSQRVDNNHFESSIYCVERWCV